MTSLPVSVLVLGIGIVRSQSIGYWVLGAELGIVLTLQQLYKWIVLAVDRRSIIKGAKIACGRSRRVCASCRAGVG